MNKLAVCLLLAIIIGTLSGVDNVYFNAERAPDYLDIFSPYTEEETDEVVHPDVVYVPSGWNGYKYWMSYTPFPNSAPQFENPCIVASQDGLVWSVPSGLTNPVVQPYDEGYDPNNYYLSDSDLILSPDGQTMYLCWRDHAGWNAEYFGVSSSTDGINWSSPTYPFYTLSTNGERILSPALVYNGSGYELYTVNSKSTPRTYYRRTASTPTGPWGNKTQVNVPLYDGSSWMLPVYYTGQLSYASMVWHWDILFENNEYWMIAAVGGATDTQSISLWVAKSDDGLSWTFDNNPLLEAADSGWDKYIYRATAIPNYQNNVMNLKIWYSSNGATAVDNLKWHIGYTDAISPEYEVLAVELTEFMASMTANNRVSIQWSTASEMNAVGFNIYSNDVNNLGTAGLANSQIIQATNSSMGASYSYLDKYPPDSDILYYWLEMVSMNGDTELYGPVLARQSYHEDTSPDLSLKYGLLGAYPNPFNPSTEIGFNLLKSGGVDIQVFSLQGKLVWTYKAHSLPAGRHSVLFDTSDEGLSLSSGVYFCKYTDSLHSQISKLVLLK
ncbi:MAG: T9SS type A sorting domain-containing protein [Candidatus Cloacimonetes bacterium]|nr:T9SS type A sorting domain-containing protein [Candidatus Cloacimonadota bacterium]